LELIDALILGAVQGIAEWLPVSSSGHLVVFRRLFGLESGVSFDIFLHFSALLVILIFFRKDIISIFKKLPQGGRRSSEFRFLLNVAAATAVTAIFGIFLRPYMASLSTIKTVPFTFLFTSLLLFASRKKGKTSHPGITLKKALFIGMMQGIALFPGVSRSGATISAAKMAGAENEEAFRFSFLLAIPAISGAILFEMGKLKMMPFPFLLAGFSASFLLGLASLSFLKKTLIKGRFHLFGFYTLALSLLLFFFRL